MQSGYRFLYSNWTLKMNTVQSGGPGGGMSVNKKMGGLDLWEVRHNPWYLLLIMNNSAGKKLLNFRIFFVIWWWISFVSLFLEKSASMGLWGVGFNAVPIPKQPPEKLSFYFIAMSHTSFICHIFSSFPISLVFMWRLYLFQLRQSVASGNFA